ncbi:hypothetical protein WN55_08991 [Dufourea novaeangliae]|uniref:Uncharacterized protein n=1 Tax=Dufourea novaeangliae TaxID=178035 RepID=A0A154P5Z6_DUFNO|nr:hypothetical protein WN55_08991 [Dufourea novaeangliae]
MCIANSALAYILVDPTFIQTPCRLTLGGSNKHAAENIDLSCRYHISIDTFVKYQTGFDSVLYCIGIDSRIVGIDS